MICSPQSRPGIAIAGALGLLSACGGDDVTGPPADLESPIIEITAAPEASPARQEVSIAFTATDGIALASIECMWGAPGATTEFIPVTGTSTAKSCSYAYEVPGRYTIVIRATDAAGNETSREHGITIGDPIPEAPGSVGASVRWTQATVWWTPGEAASTHRVVVSHAGGLEPDRVFTSEDPGVRTAVFEGLSWNESYEAVVTAENESGRAESAPFPFDTPPLAPPVLTDFHSPGPATHWYYPDGGPDPTCLVLAWQFSSVVQSYRVVLSEVAGGGSFDVHVAALQKETTVCAADYPIEDGITYRAQVFATYGGEELGSNSRDYTVDFGMGYPATGRWLLVWYDMGYQAEYTLELEDGDGEISGSWTTVSKVWEDGSWHDYNSVRPVTGTRHGLAVELSVERSDSDSDIFAGYFDGPDTLKISLYNPMAWHTMLIFHRQ